MSPAWPEAALRGLRAWQESALQAWAGHERRGIVEVATGGGKTRFALACAASLAKSSPTYEVVVPTTALADQWYVSLVDEAGVDPSGITMLTSRSRPNDLRLFNIVVINTARRLDSAVWADTNRVLIVDECHRAASAENSKALTGETMAALGLSATPDRQYDSGLDDVLVPALGPLIYRYSLPEATRDGILNEFELSNVRVPLSVDEDREYAEVSRRVARAANRGVDDETYLALLRMRARISANALARLPTAVRVAELYRGARTLIFHETIDGAESILAMLRDRGHSATVYHSRLGTYLRRENLRLFRRGVYDVMVTCRALDEGVNIPEVEVAIIAAATASDRQRIQRLGRVLRPSPGKSVAQVYTIYATSAEEERLRGEAQRLEGVAATRWLSAEVS
jgi:superfamily II DNA or RNA helicase